LSELDRVVHNLLGRLLTSLDRFDIEFISKKNLWVVELLFLEGLDICRDVVGVRA
jgi:hypothetical protein